MGGEYANNIQIKNIYYIYGHHSVSKFRLGIMLLACMYVYYVCICALIYDQRCKLNEGTAGRRRMRDAVE